MIVVRSYVGCGTRNCQVTSRGGGKSLLKLRMMCVAGKWELRRALCGISVSEKYRGIPSGDIDDQLHFPQSTIYLAFVWLPADQNVAEHAMCCVMPLYMRTSVYWNGDYGWLFQPSCSSLEPTACQMHTQTSNNKSHFLPLYHWFFNIKERRKRKLEV